jgi:glycerate-2-kinase
VLVVGVGKCAADAAEALEEIMGDRIMGGAVIDVKTTLVLKKIKAFQGSHPLPSSENIAAAKEIVELLRGLQENDLVIFVVSGGGSTLLCLPDDAGCEEEVAIFEALTKAGATIQELNTVRKHLSFARGGYLASYAYPAHHISLIFSDVPGDDLQFIASGPTIKDTTTIDEALAIIEKYNIRAVCTLPHCGLIETPKDEKYFAKGSYQLIVSNEIALEAMAGKAKELGYEATVCSACLTGEAKDVGAMTARALHDAPKQSVFLYGGETTVTVSGRGKGGRNLEVALGALGELRNDELILTLASDGHDNSDFAGAIVDKETKKHILEKDLDEQAFLADNNEYPLFESTGDYIATGPTGSNVSDLMIVIKE